jgi:hypothetical protein
MQTVPRSRKKAARGFRIPPICCTALLINVILNRLLHRLERARINLGVLAGEEPNRPLIDQFFGGELFSHAPISRASR